MGVAGQLWPQTVEELLETSSAVDFFVRSSSAFQSEEFSQEAMETATINKAVTANVSFTLRILPLSSRPSD